MHTILKGKAKEVVIGINRSFVMIGEKINPTGRKKLAAALTEGNYDYVRQLVENQIAWGAEVLDINVGVPGLDEVAIIPKIIDLVTSITDIPLCLDSDNPAVLAAGLAVAPGKPLVNSVSGEEKRLESVLPIVKDRGAAVIGLTMDGSSISNDPEARLSIAGKILERAARLGIPAEDVIIDPLVLTVGADQKAGLVTLRTIELVRKEFGVNINLGASNVSFGLPDRHTVNQAFLSLAIGAGASCAITDPEKLSATVKAADLLLGRDDFAAHYITNFRRRQKLGMVGDGTPAKS